MITPVSCSRIPYAMKVYLSTFRVDPHSKCLEKWRPYAYETVLRIAEHELGHALGEQHDDGNPDNVMYYKITSKYETDVEERGQLAEGASLFYPVCTKNIAAQYSFVVTSTAPLNIYVVPSKPYNMAVSCRVSYKDPPLFFAPS